jgi:hypothetical protein
MRGENVVVYRVEWGCLAFVTQRTHLHSVVDNLAAMSGCALDLVERLSCMGVASGRLGPQWPYQLKHSHSRGGRQYHRSYEGIARSPEHAKVPSG